MSTHIHTRRYDLDWLRILAFGLLIFYHIGMFYVSWGWHVKSVHANPAPEPLMKLLNPWRLSLLFFISGIALRFALDKANLAQFTWQRSLRLFIPIVFGIYVIVMPQAWLQLLESGEIDMGWRQFYPLYFKGDMHTYSVLLPTWNHLWYVVYLLVYTWILIPLARPIASFMENAGERITKAVFGGKLGALWVLILPTAPFLINTFYLAPLYPSTHALAADWANHQLYFSIILFAMLIAKDKWFWGAVARAFTPALCLTSLIIITATLVWTLDMKHSPVFTYNVIEFFEEKARKSVYAWFAIIAILGAAQRWLNRPSRVLAYMTEAIFPWYILHQTLIIMAGYWLTRQSLSAWPEFLLVTCATFAGCALIHEFLIRRWWPIRPLFGLKLKPARFPRPSHKESAPQNTSTV
ncbi:MAG: hypothetical protein COA69_04035 [Robiginitomaculum sp.]|nr:MAG: hypothetical protein COA69_04035 [Robiginitomaculum sp.]